MKPVRKFLLLLLVTTLLATAGTEAARAAEGWQAVGFRAGTKATGDTVLHEYELFTTYVLPWGLGEPGGWELLTKVDGTAGMLHGDGHNGLIVSAGPGIGVKSPVVPLELEGGIRAAFLSQDTFGGRDLNGNVQFISHIGLNLRIAGPIGVGYNFQHMSNADMNGTINPGLNMHMISLIWYFQR